MRTASTLAAFPRTNTADCAPRLTPRTSPPGSDRLGSQSVLLIYLVNLKLGSQLLSEWVKASEAFVVPDDLTNQIVARGYPSQTMMTSFTHPVSPVCRHVEFVSSPPAICGSVIVHQTFHGRCAGEDPPIIIPVLDQCHKELAADKQPIRLVRLPLNELVLVE